MGGLPLVPLPCQEQFLWSGERKGPSVCFAWPLIHSSPSGTWSPMGMKATHYLAGSVTRWFVCVTVGYSFGKLDWLEVWKWHTALHLSPVSYFHGTENPGGFYLLPSPKPNCPLHFLSSWNNVTVLSQVGARTPCKTVVKIIHDSSSVDCQSYEWSLEGWMNEVLSYAMETSVRSSHLCWTPSRPCLSPLEQTPRTNSKFPLDATGMYAVGQFVFLNNNV